MRSLSRFFVSGLVALAASGAGEVQAREVLVDQAASRGGLVAVEWVHARVTTDGIAVAGRLHQGAGRTTRAGVWVIVAPSAAGRRAQARNAADQSVTKQADAIGAVRSTAFAVAGGGASFSLLLPRGSVSATGPLTISIADAD